MCSSPPFATVKTRVHLAGPRADARVVRSCLDKRRIIEPKHSIEDTAEIVCVERLGGLLKSYHRLAA